MFHSRDGFCFSRLADGSVRISLQSTAAFGETLAETTLTNSEWASVGAAVCARGETGGTWQEALDFHEALA